jgi:cullin 3
VLGKHGETLYRRVSDLERDWLRSQVLPRVTAVLSPSLLLDDCTGSEDVIERRAADERLMKTLKVEWGDYIISMNMTTDVLMYMVCATGQNAQLS